jgi:uncharacterized protein (DUF1501 family)
MTTRLTRRTFLGGAAATTAACTLSSAAFPSLAFAADGAGDTLVVVVLRGGLDGLSAVVPVGDAGYHDRRKQTGVDDREVIGLDSRFGLHPALAPLADLYRGRSLAIVHAVGSPDRSRSHFVQQDILEQAGGAGGWLARHLNAKADGGPLRGAGLSTRQPTLLDAANGVVSADDLDGLDLRPGDPRRDRVAATLAQLHGGTSQDVTARGALGASAILERAGLDSAPPAGLGYRPDEPWHRKLHQVATLVNRDAGLQAAVVDLYGWDTHAGQGRASVGQLRALLDRLASGLAAFQREIGSRQGRVTTVVISEFGRRVAENASEGTDHGRGGVAFVIGAGVRGGQVYGSWPGLAADQLDDGDLRVTTDSRDVFGEVLARRHGATNLGAVFPGYAPRSLGICA